VNRYFKEGRWWPNDRTRLFADIGSHHRKLSTIISSFLDAGFTLDGADESQAPADVVAENPWYGEVAEVLTLRWRMPGIDSTRCPAGERSTGPGRLQSFTLLPHADRVGRRAAGALDQMHRRGMLAHPGRQPLVLCSQLADEPVRLSQPRRQLSGGQNRKLLSGRNTRHTGHNWQ
jgi:hypothetical protein